MALEQWIRAIEVSFMLVSVIISQDSFKNSRCFLPEERAWLMR